MRRVAGKNALAFIFITVMIDSIGLGIIIPIVPKLLESLSGLALNDAALWGGLLTLTYAMMQFVFMPIIGNLSDRFGRRLVLLLSLFALGIDYLVLALAPTLAWLFVGRLISGAAGATYSTANAFIADVSPPEKRAQNFGLVGAAFGIGFVVGPALSGLMVEHYDKVSVFADWTEVEAQRLPFYAAAALSLLNFAYGFIFLPESLPKENRRAFSWRRANPLGTLKSIRKVPGVSGLLAVVFLLAVAHVAYPTTWSFMGYEKFSWSEGQVGLSLAAYGAIAFVCQAMIIRAVIPKFGQVRSAFLGLCLITLGYIGYAFAPAGWVLYLMMIPAALGGIGQAAISNMMSTQVEANAQGELQGAIGAVNSIAMLIAPLMMTGLFYKFADPDEGLYFPGAPFLFAGILCAVALLAFLSLRRSDEPAILRS